MTWVPLIVLAVVAVISLVGNAFQVYWFLRRQRELEELAFIDQAERRVYLVAAERKLRKMEMQEQAAAPPYMYDSEVPPEMLGQEDYSEFYQTSRLMRDKPNAGQNN